MATVYIRNFPEGLHIRAKIHALKKKTTLRELTIKALKEYLDRHEGKVR
jgi:plasmid stability protein